MATRQQTASSTDRQAGCPHILFAEVDGIYWLRGDNFTRAKNFIRLSADGKAVGFDGATVKMYIDDLTEHGVTVGVISGNRMRTITRQQTAKPEKVESTTIWLAPTFLFDERELSCLKHHVNGNSSIVMDLVETMRTQLPDSDPVKEFGTLYIYQVSEDLYEVDWEMTTIPKTTVEALALAAHQTGQILRCELVAPKSKRVHSLRQTRRTTSAPKPQFTVSEPVAYGQLRFEI